MANLYFCHAGVRSHLALRAVLSGAEIAMILARHTNTFLGGDTVSHDSVGLMGIDSAVLCVEEPDSSEKWRPGWYRFETSLDELSSELLTMSK